MNATARPFRLPRPSATMLAIAAALAAPAFCMLLPGAAYAQDKAKYMADSTSQGPGGKIGCPAGRRENLDNRVGLMPCVEDHAPVNGTPREPEKNLGACGGGNVSWAINGNTCAGWISNGAHGGKSTAISSNGNTGSAQFQCYDGRWSGPFSGSCVPPVTCPDTQVSWVGVDGTCAGTLPKTLANSAAWAAGVRMVTNNRPGNAPDPNNSYSAVCQSNGQWRVNSKKCDVLPSGCGAQTVYWNQSLNWDTSAKGCYGPTTAAQNGQTVRVTDQNPSQDTSDPGNYATWACMDGEWSPTGGQCLANWEKPPQQLTKTVPVYHAGLYTCNDGTCHEWEPELFCGFVDIQSGSRGSNLADHERTVRWMYDTPGVFRSLVTPECYTRIEKNLSHMDNAFGNCSITSPWEPLMIYGEKFLSSSPIDKVTKLYMNSSCSVGGGP